FLARAKLIESDPALYPAFLKENADLYAILKHMANTIKNKPRIFPLTSTITALQTTMMDNWPDGKRTKGYPSRYKVSLKAWQGPSHHIDFSERGSEDWKGNVKLVAAEAII